MAMEMHNAPECDMDRFIKEWARLFHNKQLRGHLSLFFCIHFFKQCVSIVLQHALDSTIERKITLASGACSRSPITIKSHNLHVGDIRGAVGEIASYHEKLAFSLFLGPSSCVFFRPFFGLPLFVSPGMVLAIVLFLTIC
jgi:hypothetical protein